MLTVFSELAVAPRGEEDVDRACVACVAAALDRKRVERAEGAIGTIDPFWQSHIRLPFIAPGKVPFGPVLGHSRLLRARHLLATES